MAADRTNACRTPAISSHKLTHTDEARGVRAGLLEESHQPTHHHRARGGAQTQGTFARPESRKQQVFSPDCQATASTLAKRRPRTQLEAPSGRCPLITCSAAGLLRSQSGCLSADSSPRSDGPLQRRPENRSPGNGDATRTRRNPGSRSEGKQICLCATLLRLQRQRESHDC